MTPTSRYSMPFSVILGFSSFMVRSSLILFNILPKRTVLFCYFYMYCTLTDPKFFRRLSYCRFCFYYVMCNLHCTFFDIILQRKIPRRHRFYSVCGGFMWYVLLIYLLEEHRNNINSKCNDRRNNGSDLPDVILFVHLCFFFQSWLFNLMRSHQSVSVLPQ